MIHPVPTPSLETQLLTEERVAWIWNVSPRTVRGWRRQRKLPCVKKGKNVVRYQAADVLADILGHYRATARPLLDGFPGPEDLLWQRFERLIASVFESQLAKHQEAA